jgi:hypothetical protein
MRLNIVTQITQKFLIQRLSSEDFLKNHDFLQAHVGAWGLKFPWNQSTAMALKIAVETRT